MRVCQISRAYPTDVTPGWGTVAYNLAKYNPDVGLYIAKMLPGNPIAPPPHVRLVRLAYPEPRGGRDMGRLMTLWLVLGKLVGSLLFLIKAFPHLSKYRPDIAHIHTPLPLLLGVFCRTVLRAKLVLTFHGADIAWLKYRPLRWAVDRWVDLVACVSAAQADQARRILPGKRVVHIPNGVDMAVFYNRGMKRGPYLLAIGDLKWQKGYQYLLRAMRNIADEEPAFCLRIAGDGPLATELKEMTSTLGLNGRVEFAGMVSQEQIIKWLNESKVFVMSSMAEGMPRALLEALACGTPVVVTDVGSCAEVAAGSGYVVPPGDSQSLAQAILDLIRDDDLWQRCSSQGPTVAEAYTWEASAHVMQKEYCRLLGSQPQSGEATHS